MGRELGGELQGAGLRIGIVVARFNDLVTSRLLEGAQAGLRRLGVADVDVAWVPGAMEIPLVAQRLARSGQYQAVICLGAVIRGSTPHFDYVAGGVANGVARVALESGLPVIFGVLTTDTLEQALERAGSKHGNKGYDAAFSAVEMANLLRILDAPESVDTARATRRAGG
jgi:6,7-dimethyl-8-ribityllumazine synthase